MEDAPQFVLGFDPGGEGAFGWSVCRVGGGRLNYQESGLAKHAHEAFSKSMAAIRSLCGDDNPKVLAAGIDAPLFWSRRGNRDIDRRIRKKVEKLAGQERAKSVMAVNSLRGGALVQGLLLANYLNEDGEFCGKITEAHPTALLVLLKQPQYQRYNSDLMDLLTQLPRNPGTTKKSIKQQTDKCHATIAAYSAWVSYQHIHVSASDWQSLFSNDLPATLLYACKLLDAN